MFGSLFIDIISLLLQLWSVKITQKLKSTKRNVEKNYGMCFVAWIITNCHRKPIFFKESGWKVGQTCVKSCLKFYLFQTAMQLPNVVSVCCGMYTPNKRMHYHWTELTQIYQSKLTMSVADWVWLWYGFPQKNVNELLWCTITYTHQVLMKVEP